MLAKKIGFMQKLMGVHSKEKVRNLERQHLEEPIHVQTEGVPVFLGQTRGVRTSHVTRRQFVLNRHFTEIISDVLATEFKRDIDQVGINITSIETKAWNKGVSIFYTTKSELDDDTRRKLKTLVTHLRTAITERRLIGRTPHVNFVYDQTMSIEQKLDEALSKAIINEKKETGLLETGSNQLYISKDLGSHEQKLISKRFEAPSDMDNTTFGLNYPLLYDEVAVKLSRGRGEASRMMTNSNFLTSAKPLFRAPKEDLNDLDPAKRWLQMQKFIVSQKQKSINLSRKQRMNEVIAREASKLVVDDTANEDKKGLAPDIDEKSSESYYNSTDQDDYGDREPTKSQPVT